MKHSTHTGDIVEAMSKLLGQFAQRGRLAKANRWGIVVWYSKRDVGKLAFEFITPDALHVQLEFEMKRLAAEGRDYIDNRMELLTTQLDAAREEKARDEQIIMLPISRDPIQKAVDRAVTSDKTVTTPVLTSGDNPQ